MADMTGMDVTFSSKDVPVEHMDYTYIEKCSNEKELARILRALRTGREGYYPDLIEFCEKKLRSMNPDHRALRKQQPILKAWDIGQKDMTNLNKDMEHWTSHMKTMDQEATEKKIFESDLQGSNVNGFADRGDLPPVRGSKTLKGSKGNAVNDGKITNPNRIKSSDYKAWDKFDVEQECEKIDQNDSTPVSGQKPVNISRNIDASNLSDEERKSKAVKEKEKGDFDEALSYYCRSICLHPIAASYNNRALVCLRLEKWEEAVNDCNTVLQFEGEGNNLKALLRRAAAYKALKRYDDATLDIHFVLKKEPNNARATGILDEIKRARSVQPEQPHEETNTSMAKEPVEKKGKKMVISEVEGDSSDGNESSSCLENDDLYSQQSPTEEKVIGNNEDVTGSIATARVTSGPVKSVTTASETANAATENARQSIEQEASTVSNMDSTMQNIEPLFPPKTAQHKAEAAQFFKAGRYSEACESYSKAITSLASILKKDDAEPSYKLASAVLYNNRAACWLKQGNDKACIDDCTKVLEIKSWDAKAFMRRASAYENVEKYPNAWADYQSAYIMDRQNTFAQNGANRMSNHLREIHGGKWRERVPKVEAYPYQSIAKFSTTDTPPRSQQIINPNAEKMAPQPDMTSESKNNTVKQSAQCIEPKDISKPGGVNSEKPLPKQSPPKETKKKTKKRNKSKSKSPQRLETPAPTVDEVEKENKRIKIRQNLFQKLKGEGNDYVKSGKYKEAIDNYTRCLSLCPKEPVSYTNRALCFLKLKKNVSAINDCTEAIKLDPCNVKAYYRRAQARKAEGYHKDALRDVKKLLDIDPGNKAAAIELKNLEKSTQQTDVSAADMETKPQKVHRKQMIIEEVDSSDSSDEGEFVLPKDNFSSTTDQPKSHIIPKEETNYTIQNINESVKPSSTQQMQKEQAHKEGNDTTSQFSTKSSLKPDELPSKTVISEPSIKSRLQDDKPLTAYEFGNLWNAITNQNNHEEYKALLLRVSPTELPSVLSNKIDDHVIKMVATVALEQIAGNRNCRYAYDMLSHLTKAKRFGMAAMFLVDSDKKVLQGAFDAMRKYDSVSTNEIEELEKVYGV